jgi:hypothetical protein
MTLRAFLFLTADYTLTEDILIRKVTITPNSSGAGSLTIRPQGSAKPGDAFALSSIQDQSAQFEFEYMLLPFGTLFDFSTNLSYAVVEYYPKDYRPGEG